MNTAIDEEYATLRRELIAYIRAVDGSPSSRLPRARARRSR